MPSGHFEQTNMALGGLCIQPGTTLELREVDMEMGCGLIQERNEGNGLQLVLSRWWLAL